MFHRMRKKKNKEFDKLDFGTALSTFVFVSQYRNGYISAWG